MKLDLQMIDIQPSSGYSGKYCSLNTVINAEGLCLACVSLVFFKKILRGAFTNGSF